jgi:TonB-dependent starch-binding outer membrane protein SusC
MECMMKQQRFKFKTLFTLLLLLTGMATTWAQNRMVTGVVTGTNGDALPSVTVLEKGTQNGIITDFDGKFSIKVNDKAATLVFTFIGYTTQEVAVGAQSAITVKLEEDTKTLGEVVVVGYGTQKKKDLTGSITTVSERNFQRGNIASPEQLIAGKIAGVAITPGSGAPGSGSRIRIRGGSSLSSDDPLIVIDGVPVSGGGSKNSSTENIGGIANGLALINPNDIESITVLKDASAAAIYGSRASNGVIMVVTKKGKKGDALNVNFSTVLSSAQPVEYIPTLTADEFRALVNAKGNDTQKKLLGTENTDWQKLIYRNAFTHDENLSFTGNVSGLPYRLSAGYLNQNGVLLNSNMDRKSVSLNVNPRFLEDHLRVDFSYKGSFVKSKFADEGAIGNALSFDPTQPAYSGKDNIFQGYREWTNTDGTLNTLAGRNPLGLLNSREDVSNVNRHIANAIVDYKFHFFPDLRLNMNVAIDRANTDGYQKKDSTAASAFAVKGVNNTYSQVRMGKTFESYLNYVKEVNGIRADVMAGYGYQDFTFEGATNNYNLKGVRQGDTTVGFVRPQTQSTLVSFFGRANLGIKDRYLATFTVRRDGSSRLAPGYRWVTYPAAALAWRMSNDGIGKSLFSDLKLRLGYGITGQQDGLNDYDGLKRFSAGGNTAQYPFGGAYIQTLRPEGFNELLTWQQTVTTNFGIDFTTKNERISGAVDYYVRETSKLLAFINLPAGSNFTNRIFTNVGTIDSRGVEFTLNTTPIKSTHVTWEANFILARNQNKITKLSLVDDPKVPVVGFETGDDISGAVGNKIQFNAVGSPKSSFYVYQQVYDAAGKPLEGVYVDRNKDGKITGDDRYLFQKPDADYTLGFSSNLSYKHFNFGFVLRGSIGNYMYNNVNAGGTFGPSSLNNLFSPARNVLETGFGNSQPYSDYYMENASFLKMDNLNFGYDLSSYFQKKFKVRLTAIVQNVFRITTYSGVDPEVIGGIDKNVYLRPRTYSLGLNVNF